MLKDITLGQYFPGDTFVHRLDPRTKLLAVILYIVALFNAKTVITYGIVILCLALCVAVSRVSFRGHDLIRFLDEGGDKAQGDGHHHGQLMHRQAQLLQGPQQVLQGIGETDGAGGVGQKEGAHDQEHDAQHHGDGGIDARQGDAPQQPHMAVRAARPCMCCATVPAIGW